MRKIALLLLLILQINLLAQEELPAWIKTDPDNKGVYFRGVSTWYVSDDARTRGLSKKDALNKAYAQVSDYFGLNIASTFEMKESNKYTSIKSTLKTKTNQLIFDLKAQKTFIEYSEDEENYREHVLLLLDDKTKLKIQNEMKKDKAEFNELKRRILKLMDEKQYFKAQNVLEVAKGKRSAFMDNTILTIEKRLLKLIDGMIVSNLSIDKKVYKPDEEISLEVSLNQEGYLYLFYVTGSDVEMIYPNIYNRSPYVKKEKLISFPNENISSLVAYEEDLNKKVSFYSIASKKNLSLKQYAIDKSDGVYIFSKHGEYKKIIQKCIDDSLCTARVVDFKISNKASSSSATVKFYANNKITRGLIKYFKSKGIQTKASKKQIVFSVKKESKYSRSLEINITSFKITASLYKKSKLAEQKRYICDEDELEEYLYDIYQEFEDL